MHILACVKRVPDTGSRLSLEPGGRAVQTRNLGFTISPHEECAVEEAVRLIERFGGEATVLSLGPPEADEQLRDAMARGMTAAVLLETDGSDWDAMQTAAAIVDAVRRLSADGRRPDLLLFGNESADCGGYQVGIRVAHALDLPCVTGVKRIEIRDGRVAAATEGARGWDVYELPLPAVLTVKEGLNLPRHPSLRGAMAARRKPITRVVPDRIAAGLELVELRLPEDEGGGAQMLGNGRAAVPSIVEVLERLEVI